MFNMDNIATTNREIEVRFLEIDKEKITETLRRIGAKDQGEKFIEEYIFYDQEGKWINENKIVRIRKAGENIMMAYKHNFEHTATGTEEIEMKVSDMDKAKSFLETLGLKAVRYQQKRRHTFLFDSVIVEIDEYPNVPAYLEIEGPSELILRDAARALELDWSKARFENLKTIIEKDYNIPVSKLAYYTFDRIE